MHEKLAAVFSEHRAPKHCCKRRVHDQVSPIVRLAALAQQQVLEHRTLITEATLSPDHDPGLDGKLEMMHQTYGAMERAATALSAAARELAQSTTQMDRYDAEWKLEIEAYEAAKAVGDATA